MKTIIYFIVSFLSVIACIVGDIPELAAFFVITSLLLGGVMLDEKLHAK